MTVTYLFPGLEATGPAPSWTAKGPPWSLAFFCTHCGEIWARRRIPNSRWLVYNGYCPEGKGYYSTPAGSIWGLLTEADIAVLPESVVFRELHLHLDHYETRDINDF